VSEQKIASPTTGAKKEKVVLTGIKPTDHPHIGNYIGAIRPGIDLAGQFENSLLFIADYHAITTVQTAKELEEFTNSVTAAWIASGVDPKKTIIYRQSDVPEIFELAWILSCVTPKGLLNRAHAYKAKVQENQDAGREDLDFGISMGLYSYPVLMAADILLFNTDVVPVGEDQVQHVEIARDVAQKFNRVYGDVLKLPKHLVKTEKVVPGLDGRKMSKSYGNHIPLFLEEKKLRKMVMKIVTDSTPPEAPKDPKASVLFDLYKEFSTPEQLSELAALYAKGIGWGDVKQRLFERIHEHFKGPSDIYNDLMSNPSKLVTILADGAHRARELARPTMNRVRHAVRGDKI
jgi:tryptophanyl-tRNA synthetase